MLIFPRRGKGPLLVLLFATLIGTSGCVTSSQSDQEASGMEASQNEDYASENGTSNATATDESQAQGPETDAEMSLSENENMEDLNAEEKTPPAPPPAEMVSEDRGHFSGKAGNPMVLGLPEEGSKMAYIVQKGDTLSKIAKRIFSDHQRWRDLAVASSVKNPNVIYPGNVIYYQLDSTTLAFAKKYENLEREETCAYKGETLLDVSKRIYGDKDQWKFLWRHNHQIGDPNHLKLGAVIYFVSPHALASLTKHQYSKFNSPQFGDSTRVTKHMKKQKV